MKVSVRAARAADVPALVQLRMAGKALAAAAREHAARCGVALLLAPVLASNAEAVGFYSGAGFRPHGIILGKDLTAGEDGAAPPPAGDPPPPARGGPGAPGCGSGAVIALVIGGDGARLLTAIVPEGLRDLGAELTAQPS